MKINLFGIGKKTQEIKKQEEVKQIQKEQEGRQNIDSALEDNPLLDAVGWGFGPGFSKIEMLALEPEDKLPDSQLTKSEKAFFEFANSLAQMGRAQMRRHSHQYSDTQLKEIASNETDSRNKLIRDAAEVIKHSKMVGLAQAAQEELRARKNETCNSDKYRYLGQSEKGMFSTYQSVENPESIMIEVLEITPHENSCCDCDTDTDTDIDNDFIAKNLEVDKLLQDKKSEDFDDIFGEDTTERDSD